MIYSSFFAVVTSKLLGTWQTWSAWQSRTSLKIWVRSTRWEIQKICLMHLIKITTYLTSDYLLEIISVIFCNVLQKLPFQVFYYAIKRLKLQYNAILLQYYSGEKVAPVLTIFIGGNHEASNYLQELPYGGWAAPNISYLGYAGSLFFKCSIL